MQTKYLKCCRLFSIREEQTSSSKTSVKQRKCKFFMSPTNSAMHLRIRRKKTMTDFCFNHHNERANDLNLQLCKFLFNPQRIYVRQFEFIENTRQNLLIDKQFD